MVVVLCERPRYAFIHVPKTGGISISTALRGGAHEHRLPMVEHDFPFQAHPTVLDTPMNRSANRTPYRELYSPECRSFVAEQFTVDIEYGGYRFGD